MVHYLKQFLNQIKLTTIVYISSTLSYTCAKSYIDSKDYLIKYRNNNLCISEVFEIKSELDAIRYGAKVNFAETFSNAMIWPYVGVVTIIAPSIVLLHLLENSQSSGGAIKFFSKQKFVVIGYVGTLELLTCESCKL